MKKIDEIIVIIGSEEQPDKSKEALLEVLGSKKEKTDHEKIVQLEQEILLLKQKQLYQSQQATYEPYDYHEHHRTMRDSDGL